MKMSYKGESAAALLEWLAAYGRSDSGGVTRLLYSPAWQAAQHALKDKMIEKGFEAYLDTVGNLFGRIKGTDSSDYCILTGSHIDTVIDGGKYDGSYGIAASMLAVERLVHRYGRPKKTIEIVSFCEEEGSRFPITFWGSRNVMDQYTLEDVKKLSDKDGISFIEAMKSAGFDKNVYSPPVRTDIERFIEVHIEQGIVLEQNQHTLGIVSHIVGQKRFMITITGESNHAGTTPMPYRKDALALASDFIHYLTNYATSEDGGIVATVGKLTVQPNVANVISGQVEFSLDVRHHDKQVLQSFCENIFTYLNEIAGEQFGIKISEWMNVDPVPMCPHTAKMIEEIAKEQNVSYQYLVSGAGHDSQVLGTKIPSSLLFVPSKNGISHSPYEFTSEEDLESGIRILQELLYRLAY